MPLGQSKSSGVSSNCNENPLSVLNRRGMGFVLRAEKATWAGMWTMNCGGTRTKAGTPDQKQLRDSGGLG